MDNEIVFDDNTFTWGNVATTFGVGENSKRTRTSMSTAPSKGSTNAL